MTEHRLARVTRTEANDRAAAGAVAVLPVASLEQHGNHLPVGTDTFLVEHVCERAAARCGADVLVAPAIWTGFSPHHTRFGATVSLRAETLLALIDETASSIARWLPTIAIVNGHGGNRGLLQAIALEREIPITSYWDVARAQAAVLFGNDGGSIGHAGEAETSMMLALDTGLVGEPAAAFEEVPDDRELIDPALGSSGVIGNPFHASSKAGERFLDAAARGLAEWLERIAEPQGGS